MKKQRWIALLVAAFCTLMVFSACGNNDKKDSAESGTINIASKPMTEQYILTEMLGLLIEQDTDLKVNITQGIGGGTSNIHPAMVSGDFDIYPEYTGTAWTNVLKHEEFPDDDTLWAELQKEYEDDLNMEWVGLYGFENTYGMIVGEEYADEYDLKTYSDLAAISDQLVFGANYDYYERADGYEALCKEYGYKFKNEVDIDIGLKYTAFNDGQIDVMPTFTTDGQLTVAKGRVLIDDKDFYQTYYCGSVVRKEVLEKYPQLRATLLKMQDLILEDDMAKMNYEVEEEGKEPIDVARAFLQSKGLLNQE